MKVRDLIRLLSDFEQDFQVIVPHNDAAGVYKPAMNLRTRMYIPTSSFDGVLENKENENSDFYMNNAVVLE